MEWTLETETKLRTLLETETLQDTADALGCHRDTIKRAKKRLGIVYRKKTGSNFKIIREWPEFTSEQEQVLVGSLLGDGWITRKSPAFRIKQARHNREYIKWMHEFFCSYMTDNIYDGEEKYKDKIVLSSLCYTRTAPRFSDLWNKWYPSGKKEVPEDVVLTPLVCAHWHVQDGQNRQNKREVILNTNAYSPAEVQLLVNKLWWGLGIKSHWRWKDPASCTQPVIVMGNKFGEEGYFEFLEMVRPHIIWDCFQYKCDVSEVSKRPDRHGPKLNQKQAEKIRSLYKSGNYTQYEIADMFEVCQPTVWSIIHNKSFIKKE